MKNYVNTSKRSFTKGIILTLGIFLLFSFSAVQAGTSPDTVSIPGNIKDFQLFSSNSGWVIIENDLFLTTNNGNSWRNISPGVSPQLRAAHFLNDTQGFIVTTEYTGSYSIHKLGITTDSGSNWQFLDIASFPVSSPSYGIEAASLFFLDNQNGWVTLKIKTSSNFSVGKLYATTDGGKTWQARPIPIGEPVLFIDQNTGFTVGGAAKDAFFRTTDGGRTWHEVILDDARNIIHFLPSFSSTTDGVLPAFQNTTNGTTLTLFTSSDQGQTWQKSTSTLLSTQQDYFAPTAIHSTHLLTLTNDQFVSIDLIDGTIDSSPRGSDLNPTQIQILPSASGWAINNQSQCDTPDDPTTCTMTTNLIATQDGGESWTTIPTPNVSTIADLPTFQFEPRQAIILNDYTNLMIGQGFDMCEITGYNNMRVWKNNSPYNAVNLYIGGVSRACPNLNLSKDYVESLSLLGWKFIPTWVGHQAACTSYRETMSYGLSTAEQQGRDNATDAARIAYKLGLRDANVIGSAPDYIPPLPGGVIYFDLEAFNTLDTACLNAAKAFINGWVHELHKYGITAGVYGSVCASALDEFATLDNPPDVIWPARWNQDSYYSPITPDNLPCLTDSMWGNHERILQYTGTHTENWGGVSLYIDLDTIDGIVSDLSQHVGVPEQQLENPSFETGALTPWEINPDSSACNWTLSTYSDDARTGNAALLLNKTSLQTTCLGAKQSIAQVPTSGEKYRFAVWVRSATSDLRSLRLSITGTGTTPETTSQKFSGIKDTWSCIEVSHTISQSNLTGLEVAVQLEDSDGIDLHLDDAVFSVGTSSLCPSTLVPTNLRATSTADLNQISLSWDAAPESTYYRIFRADSPSDTPAQIGISETTSFLDTGLPHETTYSYWVQGCTPNGCSTESDYTIGATASPHLLFSDDFETGGFGYWSSLYNSSALDVCTAGSIFNSYGFCLDTVANQTKYATHNLVTPSNDISLSFWLDPNSASFSKFTILQGVDSSDSTNFEIMVKYDGEYKLQYRVRANDNLWVNSSWYAIADAPNLIKITWNSTYLQARSTLDFSDTSLWVNNNKKVTLNSAVNYGQTIDQINLGMVTSPTTANSSHTIYIDEVFYEGPLYLRP